MEHVSRSPVPGFPRHPHRGFERSPLYAEALSIMQTRWVPQPATARDAQWLTAGDGINHAEMFPLLDETKPNTLDLFQISQFTQKINGLSPTSMFWAEKMPKVTRVTQTGRMAEATLIAGHYDGLARSPPPTAGC